eukprot:4938418-Prymnesium_polylepis.1
MYREECMVFASYCGSLRTLSPHTTTHCGRWSRLAVLAAARRSEPRQVVTADAARLGSPRQVVTARHGSPRLAAARRGTPRHAAA